MVHSEYTGVYSDRLYIYSDFYLNFSDYLFVYSDHSLNYSDYFTIPSQLETAAHVPLTKNKTRQGPFLGALML
jgi:hypothetical protein